MLRKERIWKKKKKNAWYAFDMIWWSLIQIWLGFLFVCLFLFWFFSNRYVHQTLKETFMCLHCIVELTFDMDFKKDVRLYFLRLDYRKSKYSLQKVKLWIIKTYFDRYSFRVVWSVTKTKCYWSVEMPFHTWTFKYVVNFADVHKSVSVIKQA